MFTYKVKYTDYLDNEREETLMFHLTEAEIAELQLSHKGGLTAYIHRVTESKDNVAIAELFKEILIKSYGVRSDDGRRFMKNKTIVEEFVESPAYSIMYMKLASDDQFASEFMNKVVPKELAEKAAEANKEATRDFVSNK